MRIIWIILLIILASIFLGCVQKQQVAEPLTTPAPTPSPTPVYTTPASTQIPGYIPNPISLIQYRSWIDSDYGFYKVRAIKDNASYQLPLDLDERNFTINERDIVRWINDDMYDYSLTLVSNEGLWTNQTGFLEYQGKFLEYTFNNTGTYTFYIKEFPKIAPQKISVK
ncbi:MAG TPA: hypothetical protein VF354_01015 [Candidatus Methanoperedens sp.]